jgi:hypothetical protein
VLFFSVLVFFIGIGFKNLEAVSMKKFRGHRFHRKPENPQKLGEIGWFSIQNSNSNFYERNQLDVRFVRLAGWFQPIFNSKFKIQNVMNENR